METLNNKNKRNVFQVKGIAALLATACALAWATAFPLVKIGMNEFHIAADDTGAKTLFAGVRFFFAGIIVLIIAKLMKRSFKIGGAKNGALVLLFGFVNTALHYFFYYIGLSNSAGSRSAIIDSAGSFLLILSAVAFFKEEKLTAQKLIGCALGFSGIIIINLGGLQQSAEFTFSGDGMLIIGAVASAMGGILTRIVTRRTDPLVATGISLLFGGALLSAAGFAAGGRFETFNLYAALALLALIAISSFSFSLYNQLLCYNPVAEIAIFNSLIPIMGVVFSCAFLGEPFMFRYIIAAAAVAAGVYIVNSEFAIKLNLKC